MGFVFNLQEHAEKRAQEEALAMQALENTKIPVPQTALAPLQTSVGDFPTVHIKQHESQFIPINAGTMTDSLEVEARPFLVQNLLLLGYLSLLVAPGGVGKSVFAILIAMTVATGRDFCGLGLKNRARVLIINNEDDQSELHRRIAALCQFFGICREELDDWLYVYSGYEHKIMMAQEEDGLVNKSAAFYELREFVKTKDIKLVIFDPFVSTHSSNENDNNKMDMVMSVFKEFVSSIKASGLIVHHTPKMGGTPYSGNADAGRGASAIKDAGRICFTLCRMDAFTAEQYNISEEDRLRLVGLQDAKTNYSLPTGKQLWFYLESVILANGDSIGVPRRYILGDPVSSSKKNPEQVKSDNTHRIASIALSALGIDGGKIQGSDLLESYMLNTGLSRSSAQNNFGSLPSGSTNSRLVTIEGKKYRIYQTKEDKTTAPRMIHVEAQD